MNPKLLIGAIAVIIALPILYILSGFYTPAPEFGFRGLKIAQIEPGQGELILPTIEQDQAGATMRAVFKPGYIEKIARVKSPNPAGLDLTIDSTSEAANACMADGKMLAKAEFTIAAQCAEKEYATWQADKKTALFVDADQKLIVFGATGNNLARVFHNGMVATYLSPDMLQSDRKREACIISVMLNHMIGSPVDEDAACAAIK
jgi:hypothetical protein